MDDSENVTVSSGERSVKLTKKKPIPETFHEEVPVDLRQDEIVARATDLSGAIRRRMALDDEKKRFTDDWKDRATKIDQEVQRLNRIVGDRKEGRSVECIEKRNEVDCTMETVRLDTGEVIRARPMTPNERQLKLVSIKDGSPLDVDLDVSFPDDSKAGRWIGKSTGSKKPKKSEE